MDKNVNESGLLDVGNGHHIYFEDFGNKDAALPIVFFHGGPGGRIKPVHRHLFNPKKQRVIFFDQRGSGNSTPFASTLHNTTADIISDTDKLLNHLNISDVAVFGASWGSTLALLYAIHAPSRVKKILIRGVFLATKGEQDFIYFQVRTHFPEVWERFMSLIPKDRQNDPIGYYAEKFTSSDVKEVQQYIYEWSRYEMALMRLDYTQDMTEFNPDDELDPISTSIALLEVHYFSQGCFIEEGFILSNAHTISHIPTQIVHGRYDMVCPPEIAYKLQKTLGDNAHLHMVTAGHDGGDTVNREVMKAYVATFL